MIKIIAPIVAMLVQGIALLKMAKRRGLAPSVI
jgi:hypothetical protein